jgi:4-hydroxybenzoate polyprenyltransferase
MATARRLGIALLVAGFALAGIAGWAGGSTVSAPLIMSALLIVAILLYDGWLKQTPIGPIAMGSCRFLNILLGMSLAEPSEASWPLRIHLAAVIGVYIAGVTWFARRETGGSERWQLRSAAVVAVVALLMALALPLHRPAGGSFGGFPYLLVAFGFVIGSPAALAIAKPEPANIQTAIKRCILGLIVLDAVLATVFAGPWGLLIMMLLPPAIVLGRRVYST